MKFGLEGNPRHEGRIMLGLGRPRPMLHPYPAYELILSVLVLAEYTLRRDSMETRAARARLAAE